MRPGLFPVQYFNIMQKFIIWKYYDTITYYLMPFINSVSIGSTGGIFH